MTFKPRKADTAAWDELRYKLAIAERENAFGRIRQLVRNLRDLLARSDDPKLDDDIADLDDFLRVK